MSKRSFVWKYFNDKVDNRATCKLCLPKIVNLSCSGSSTSNLIGHLNAVHSITANVKPSSSDISNQPINIDETHSFNQSGNLDDSNTLNQSGEGYSSNSKPKQCENPNKRMKTQKTIEKFVIRQTLNEVVSRLAALDGLNIKQITNSTFIRESMKQRGYSLPKSQTTVMKLITSYAAEKKAEVKSYLMKHKEKKFSLTFDEWVSLSGRRYINVNIHDNSGRCFNLGMSRIFGSCTSKETNSQVEKMLADYGLSWNDIVASTFDGCAVNVKFGRDSEAQSQVCLNHGVHLAVLDVLYKKQKTNEASVDVSTSDEDDTDDESSTANDADKDENEDNTTEEDYKDYADFDKILTSDQDIRQTIQDVRKIVKFFRSPVRKQILENRIKKNFPAGNTRTLILDCKTRWSSLCNMIERFLYLSCPVKEALEDLNQEELLRNVDMELLQSLQKSLSPLKMAVEALGRKDANLLKAESIVFFVLDKLKKINSSISIRLYDAFKSRMIARRNVGAVSALKFLSQPSKYKDLLKNDHDLPYLSKKDVIIYIDKVSNRLFTVPAPVGPQSSGSSLSNTSDSAALEKLLREEDHTPEKVSSDIRSDIKVFEGIGKRSARLDLIYNSLKTIKPTSTDSERCFSVSGDFCTKKRTRLTDLSLNSLVILKYYFLHMKEYIENDEK